MKTIIISALLLLSQWATAQKYITKTGHTQFKASVPAFEPVEAESHSTTAILNIATGEVAALIFIKSFHFEIALMEEHFNENYMDSDKYPKAVFKGIAEGLDIDKLSAQATTLNIKGTLTVHGKTQEITTPAEFMKKDGKIIVTTDFSVSPGDFNIEIPSIVKEKISESIHINATYELVEKK